VRKVLRVFYWGKNEPKSPHHEEKNCEIAIFREEAPIVYSGDPHSEREREREYIQSFLTNEIGS
jgi:hypothetical protein